MNVLVDTSVWIDHFRNGSDALIRLLTLDRVLTHPLVIGEIACGTPPAPRARTLASIALLKPCYQASAEEVLDLIEREKLFGLGCGLIDLSLLASTLITPDAKLWTLDRRLEAIASDFDVSYTHPTH